MFFDTHAHYDASWFDSDRDALLSALPQFGIGLIVNPGCDLPSSQMAVELAQRYDHVYAAVGFHPSDLEHFSADSIHQLRVLAQEPKVVAIGEIGLDYYWEKDPMAHQVQKQALRLQMALAQELDLPVIVHDREAHGDSLAIVKEYPALRGVFHCYSGSVEMARELLALGWYLGFDGPVTYKNARKTVEVAEMVPLDRILIETDCPYMAPEPVRGTRCDSSLIRYVGEYIAQLKGISAEEVFRTTAENARQVYGL